MSLCICNFSIKYCILYVVLLPCSISTEFLTLMKKVSKSPLVIDVLNIQGVQRQMERLADLLGKIQKALGEYLERERASFPRYCVMMFQTGILMCDYFVTKQRVFRCLVL